MIVRVHLRENWYRDVWLFAISLVALATIVVGRDALHDSRVRSVKIACEQVNERHDRALNTLDRVTIARLTHTPLLPNTTPDAAARQKRVEAVARLPPPQRDQVAQQLALTVVLMETIVPHEDCAARARLLVP